MALRIANNIAAMNTQRWLGVADAGMKKSLERLSSGYRINRAADDAAGLAISQSFRADIASFKVASRNASEATSLLQVAEGAMDQIGNMLTRLKELATQSASENTSDSNRVKVSSEADKLLSEINRIVASTKYGGDLLIDGTLGGSATIDATGSITEATSTLQSADGSFFSYTATDAGTLASASGVLDDSLVNRTDAENVWTFQTGGTGADSNSVTVANAGMQFTGTISGTTLTFASMGDDTNSFTITMDSYHSATELNGDVFTLDQAGLNESNDLSVLASATAGTYSITELAGNIILTLDSTGKNQSLTATAGGTLNFNELGITLTLGAEYDTDDLAGLDLVVTGGGGGSATFQIGSENTADDRVTISISSVAATALDTGLTADFLSTSAKAQQALTDVNDAISQLATQRGNIGANQNRMGYAIANLATTIENVQAAESVIRDVDMASEMTYFTKNQILLQAGTAMLAQANMAPQQVLALFG